MSIFWESAKKLWIKSRPEVALVLESKVLWYEDDDNSMFLKKKNQQAIWALHVQVNLGSLKELSHLSSLAKITGKRNILHWASVKFHPPSTFDRGSLLLRSDYSDGKRGVRFITSLISFLLRHY